MHLHHREHHVVEGGSSRAVEGREESWIHRIVFSLVVVEGRVESWIRRVVLSPLGYVFVHVGNARVGCGTSPLSWFVCRMSPAWAYSIGLVLLGDREYRWDIRLLQRQQRFMIRKVFVALVGRAVECRAIECVIGWYRRVHGHRQG